MNYCHIGTGIELKEELSKFRTYWCFDDSVSDAKLKLFAPAFVRQSAPYATWIKSNLLLWVVKDDNVLTQQAKSNKPVVIWRFILVSVFDSF